MTDGEISSTSSLCPRCLAVLPAVLERKGNEVLLKRVCPEHGPCEEVIWRGEPAFESWSRPKSGLKPPRPETESLKGCPYDCGRCPEHRQRACTVLLEITGLCNLHCPVCFAASGESNLQPSFTPLAELEGQLEWLGEHAAGAVLQLSGGEPTLHPRLAEITRKAAGLFPAVQLNTNGLKLAADPSLAQKLADAGLGWVFLQFDGTDDKIFTALRGKPLLAEKLAAVENCRRAGLGVVLVPTIVPGVNDNDLGNLLRLAMSLSPAVRGLHLQPATRSGRNSFIRTITLPETLALLAAQSEGQIRPEHASPPGCEHERCSFHCRYHLTAPGELTPISVTACCSSPSGENACCAEKPEDGMPRAVETILRSWGGPGAGRPGTGQPGPGGEADAFDAFIARSREKTFSISCMAFQDARSLDLERLRGCCVHVFDPSRRLVPFCAYNLTAEDGRPLYRRQAAKA